MEKVQVLQATQSKDYRLSAIRLISILMIISCHILQAVGNHLAYYLSVGVQIFFVLSGYLYGNKTIDNTCKFYINRIKKILTPYSIFALIVLIISVLFLDAKYDFVYFVGTCIGFGGSQGCIPLLSHTWFVTYILICYLLVPVLQNIFNSDNFKSNFIRFICIAFLLHLFQFFFVINILSYYINCFIFGYFFSKCCTTEKSKKLIYILSCVLFAFLFPLYVILQENIKISIPAFIGKYSGYYIGYGRVMLGIMLFFVMLKLLDFIKIKKSVVFDFSDRYSYYIYLTHQIFILFDFSLIHKTPFMVVNIIIILVATLLSAITLKFITDFIIRLIDYFFEKHKMKKTIQNNE